MKARWIALAAIAAIATALYTQHLLHLQKSRTAVRFKISSLATAPADSSPQAIAQSIRFLAADRARHRAALRTSEQLQLDAVIELAEHWKYFLEQPPCKKITIEDRTKFKLSGVDKHDYILTSPDREYYLQSVAKLKLASQLIHSHELPGSQAYEVKALHDYVRSTEIPAPSPDFYSPRLAADIVHEQLKRTATPLAHALYQRRWF